MRTVILSILTLFVTCLSLISCNDKIDVLQAYDFNITTMPVQKHIKQGETVEIRCQLNKAGNYNDTKFYIRYFQPDGKGTLKMDDGTVFLPNDSYSLNYDTFRLYYTSECTDQQTIDIVVYDNFGQSDELKFSFKSEAIDEL